MLACLLADDRVRGAEDIQAVFAALDENRRDRDQWLVQSSRQAADMYEWRAPHVGERYDERIQKEIVRRQAMVWDFDMDQSILKAHEALGRHLA